MIYFLGLLNSLFYSVPMWILTLLLVIFKQVDKVELDSILCLSVFLKRDKWFYRKLFTDRGWSGYTMGNCILISDDYENNKTTVVHEKRHVIQFYIFGLIFLVCYFLSSLFILLFLHDKDPYFDNPFERDARRFAGQSLER